MFVTTTSAQVELLFQSFTGLLLVNNDSGPELNAPDIVEKGDTKERTIWNKHGQTQTGQVPPKKLTSFPEASQLLFAWGQHLDHFFSATSMEFIN